MDRFARAVLTLLLCFFLQRCAPLLAADAATRHLVILHINDTHGRIEGDPMNGKPYGGYARLSTLVQAIRQQEGADHVLLVDAGDVCSRGDALTTVTLGRANIDLMNFLHVGMWVPGNGDYYLGPSTLQQRISEARFPTLAANVFYRLDGSRFAPPTHILTLQGVKLGFMGLCFVRTEHPSAFLLKVYDPIETARQIVPGLRKQSDVVIALTHLGLDVDRRLADSVAGIDLIVGGHSHSILPKGYAQTGPTGKPVLIAQAGAYLHFLGRIDLDLTRSGGHWELTSTRARLIPLDGKVPEDPAVKAEIARLKATTRPTRAPAATPIESPADKAR